MTHARLVRAAALSICFASTLSACDPASARPTPDERSGTQYIVGIDISGSRTPTQLEEAQRLLEALIERTSFGDRLVFVESYQTGTDSAGQWAESLPALRTSGRVTGAERKRAQRFRVTATVMAGTFFDPARAKQVRSTDLLATLRRSAEYAKARRGRPTTVLLLSDMLNATPELNMERSSGIPDARWVAARRAAGVLPDLHGVCVFVVGADLGSARGVAARRFWNAYFKATGATFPEANYRNMVSEVSEVGCDA